MRQALFNRHHSNYLAVLQTLGSFVDGSVLPTFLEGTNVTIATETVNGTETVMVDSYGADTTIVTPAAYACNVSLLFRCFSLHCFNVW